MHKYRAKPTEVDGVKFHSQKEARRWQELKLLEKAGEITGLELQPRFPLMAPGRGNGGPYERVHLGDYVADFRYTVLGYRPILDKVVIEDVKSPPTKTPLWKWKVKHLKAQYGIDVLTT